MPSPNETQSAKEVHWHAPPQRKKRDYTRNNCSSGEHRARTTLPGNLTRDQCPARQACDSVEPCTISVCTRAQSKLRIGTGVLRRLSSAHMRLILGRKPSKYLTGPGPYLCPGINLGVPYLRRFIRKGSKIRETKMQTCRGQDAQSP